MSNFAASTAVLAAATVIVSLVFFVATHLDFFENALHTTTRGISLSLAELIWEDPERAQEVAERHGIGLVMATPDGQIAYDHQGRRVPPEQQLAVGRRYRRIDVAGPGGQTIIFFWDMMEFARAHIPLLIASICFLLVMIGATYAFQVTRLRPLQWLRTAVESVSQGDFKTRVPVVRHDEIGQVALAFNQMAGRVEQMMSDRERLLADVSHELRSPLARIKVALELLPQSDKRDLIDRDIRAMESLTTVLLEMERIRAWTDRPEGCAFDAVSLVREVVSSFEDRSPGLLFDEPESPVELWADAALVRVLLQNLLDNAIRFSLPDSRPVEIGLRGSAEAVELIVTDDGQGIADDDLERVFEPFVKLDPSRGHRVGYGLGLNLCRRIVEGHGGTIGLGRGDGRGTKVTVRFPVRVTTR